MFLEEKIEVEYNKQLENYKTIGAFDYCALLNVMVDHISERMSGKPHMLVKEVHAIVKQTDNIWRSFCKKKTT